uniref:BH3-interacting domain death agonist n=1 Tax=Felis catus TaxID=9685 RepID=A0ABI7YZR8_FELCA
REAGGGPGAGPAVAGGRAGPGAVPAGNKGSGQAAAAYSARLGDCLVPGLWSPVPGPRPPAPAARLLASCRGCWVADLGHLQGRKPDRALQGCLCHGFSDSESQEEIIQDIARQLAQIGDRMDHSIHPRVVNNLAMQFMNVNLSEEDRRKHLAAALEQVLQTYPKDMEREKTVLMLAMVLAKKVADHTPSLLRDVFRTTVNFINQNLLTYVRNLVRNEMD